ncbi:MAG: putative major pilin subunit [Lentisphaerae bacterium ADurb.Bin242]|nr:MAG: putative major pilin subunit [Lentisphaerae bacterium ADurb.Bin242]
MEKRRKEFTLIELMIVIAMIAILAGLLLPSLNRARDKARAMGCVGNMKQITLATVLYANDYNDYFPPLYNTANFMTAFEKYLNVRRDDIKEWKNQLPSKAKVYFCPDDRENAETKTANLSYFCNMYVGCVNYYIVNGMGSATIEAAHAYRLNQVRTPSVKLFFADYFHPDRWVTYMDQNSFPFYTSATFAGNRVAAGVSFRHNRQANFSYLDGHIAGDRFQKYVGTQNTSIHPKR